MIKATIQNRLFKITTNKKTYTVNAPNTVTLLAQSIKGDKGDTGDTGDDGHSLLYDWDGTQLGIKLDNESSYTYTDLKGDDGGLDYTNMTLDTSPVDADVVPVNGTRNGTLSQLKIALSNIKSYVLGTLFNTSSGHDHDGTDSKQIAYSNITGTPLKSTGAEINTGTEDGKIVTPKAIADSKLADYIRGDGWISANETWAYASATTITVPAGAAAKYTVGDKIKLTQTTVKYFYIVGVADTVLTITAGNVYTVAEAAIVNPFYSHSESPVLFNKTFSPNITITPQSGTYTSVRLLDNYFYINGIFLTWVIAFDGTLSETPSYLDLTLPVPCVQTELIEPFLVNGVPGVARIGTGGTTNVRIEKIGGNWSTGDYSKGAGVLTYKIIAS